MIIIDAAFDDLSAILQLQRLAYQSEARALNNFDIPPLKQTLPEVQEEYRKGKILKAVDDNGTLLGSVRGHIENDTAYIFKLMVHPEKQGRGIGTKLLNEIEKALPSGRYELFTSSQSHRNLALYERLGYVRYKEKQIAPELQLVYLQKIDNPHNTVNQQQK